MNDRTLLYTSMVFIRKLPLCSDVLTHLYMHVYGIARAIRRLLLPVLLLLLLLLRSHLCMWENVDRTHRKTNEENANKSISTESEKVRESFWKSTQSSCITWYRDSVLIRIVLSVIELFVYLWVNSLLSKGSKIMAVIWIVFEIHKPIR